MTTIFPQEGRETDLSASLHTRGIRPVGIKYPFAMTYFLCQHLCGVVV